MLVIYLLLLVFLLILFLFLTAIGFSLKLKILSLEEKQELKGLFTVKWLLFSHTFSVEKPGEKNSFLEAPEEWGKDGSGKEEQSEEGPEEIERTRVTIAMQGNDEVLKKTEIEKRKSEGKPEERLREKRIEVTEAKEKRVKVSEGEERRIYAGESEEKRIEIDESRGERNREERIEIGEKKEKRSIISRIRRKKEPEAEKTPEPWMTTREKLHWGLEAFKSLRKPMFRLFSDLLRGIKIKRLESYLIFGLSDPADTGILCGFIHSIAGLAYSRCRHCSFSINPVFLNPMMDFRGNMEIRVRIYSLVIPMLRFMFNRKTLSFTYSIIKEKLWGKWKFHS